MKEGFGSSRYRQQDYDKLRSLALQKKISANRSLLKMNQLQAAKKEHKENTLLKQHKTVLKQSMNKLDSAGKRANFDQNQFFDEAASEASHISMFMLSMEELKLEQDTEREEFRKATVAPIWNLREDLGGWLSDYESRLKETVDLALREDHRQIGEVVKDVRLQQCKVLEQLKQEQKALENDLETDFFKAVTHSSSKMVIEGVPEEAELLECPDENLKDLVLTEFLLLDRKFKDSLKELDVKYEHIIRPPLGGWRRDDHFLFLAVLEQYPFSLSNRRALYMDLLHRWFPRKTRAELVSEQAKCFSYGS
ncbi:putative coiled-coil domain-containing protein [Apostichopus japonicus]|uniref:Putative coiled-coil domain-containing protein n=1 Tax=Stichopus japonicus TaxID=307972 RepID=A0A2G8JDJ5_STIJA|nr:putative coiled-coil domain-containing protein [Apostichopus japonicus]PIK53852.1 putative coiled-coil domain-containing protein [Apostichopus japonicus]